MDNKINDYILKPKMPDELDSLFSILSETDDKKIPKGFSSLLKTLISNETTANSRDHLFLISKVLYSESEFTFLAKILTTLSETFFNNIMKDRYILNSNYSDNILSFYKNLYSIFSNNKEFKNFILYKENLWKFLDLLNKERI